MVNHAYACQAYNKGVKIVLVVHTMEVHITNLEDENIYVCIYKELSLCKLTGFC